MGRPLEEEMLVKYLAKRFTGTEVWTHVRLGALPDLKIPGLDPEAARRLAMPGLPEIDAIVVEGEDVYLIEAKVVKEWENLGKMIIYRELLPVTPGWEGVDVRRIKPILVMAKASPLLRQVAQKFGVQVETYMTERAYEILTKGYPSQQRGSS